MEQEIGRVLCKLPWHYDRGDVVSVVFKTDREAVKKLLPPVMELPEGPGIAVLSAVHHQRSVFGPYMGVYIGVLAIYKGENVLLRTSGMKNSFSGTVAGREMWGMPLQMGEPTMSWDGDVLNIVARREGRDFARWTVRLENRVEKPEKSRFTSGACWIRRAPWEKSEKQNVLLGGGAIPPKPEDMVFWKGSSVVEMMGGVPGDDWSVLPVHEVMETSYSYGGHGALTDPYILEEF